MVTAGRDGVKLGGPMLAERTALVRGDSGVWVAGGDVAAVGRESQLSGSGH